MERKSAVYFLPKGQNHIHSRAKNRKIEKKDMPEKLIFSHYFEEKKLFPAEIFTKKREFRPGIEAHGPFLRTDTQAPSAGGTETENAAAYLKKRRFPP